VGGKASRLVVTESRSGEDGGGGTISTAEHTADMSNDSKAPLPAAKAPLPKEGGSAGMEEEDKPTSVEESPSKKEDDKPAAAAAAGENKKPPEEPSSADSKYSVDSLHLKRRASPTQLKAALARISAQLEVEERAAEELHKRNEALYARLIALRQARQDEEGEFSSPEHSDSEDQGRILTPEDSPVASFNLPPAAAGLTVLQLSNESSKSSAAKKKHPEEGVARMEKHSYASSSSASLASMTSPPSACKKLKTAPLEEQEEDAKLAASDLFPTPKDDEEPEIGEQAEV